MIAAVCLWHDHHDAAFDEIDRRLKNGERMQVSAQALTEAYSVLTRLPAPFRLSAVDAWALLEANFVEAAEIIALDRDRLVKTLRQMVRHGIAGGRTYDGLIAACAEAGGAAVLLTFNRRHFEPAPPGILVVEPASR